MGGIAHYEAIQCARRRQQGVGAYSQLGNIITDEFHEHPTVTARQDWHGRVSPGTAYHVDNPPVYALACSRLVINDQWRGISGIGHCGIAERDHDLVRRFSYKPYRRADDHRQGALAAGQKACHVEAVLRQQMFQAVARHLPAEAPELGANNAEMRLHD